MKALFYLGIFLFSTVVVSQEFDNTSIQIPIEITFEPTTFKIPEANFGAEIPKGNFNLTQVGIPKENNLPKMIDMRSIIERENNTTKREYDMSRLTSSFQKQKDKSKSSVTLQARDGYSPYTGLRENQRGVKNISYEDSRLPVYVSPYQRRSLWDY